MQILLSGTQAGPGLTGKQEQEQISRNHVQAFWPISVDLVARGNYEILFIAFHLTRPTHKVDCQN